MNLKEASLLAYGECMQLNLNFKKVGEQDNNQESAKSFEDWAKPYVVSRVLDYFKTASPLPPGKFLSFDDENEKINYLLTKISKKKRIYLVKLPQLVLDGFTYRAIIPKSFNSQKDRKFLFPYGVPA